MIFLIFNVYSTSQTFSGISLSVKEIYPESLVNDSTIYDLVEILDIFNPYITTSNYDSMTTNYTIDSYDVSSIINPSTYHLGINNPTLEIFTRPQGRNTLRCLADVTSPECAITYTSSEEQSPNNRYNYFFEVCNEYNYCSSKGGFLNLKIVSEVRELAISGMKIKLRNKPLALISNDTTLYDLVQDLNQIKPYTTKTNYDSMTTNYTIDNYSVSYMVNSSSYHLGINNPTLEIFTRPQGRNTLRCLADVTSPECAITYTSSEEQSPNNRYNYFFEVCNEYNYCNSIGNMLTLKILSESRELVISGMKIKLKNNFPSSISNDTTLYDLVNSLNSMEPYVKSSDTDANISVYTIDSYDVSYMVNSSSYHLGVNNPTLEIFTRPQGRNTLRCLADNNNKDCSVTYTSSEEQSSGNRYNYIFEVCNANNYCSSLGEIIDLNIISENRERVFSGMRFIAKVNFFEEGKLDYISPTPFNDMKTTRDYFSVTIYDGTFNVSWANVTINGEEFALIQNGFITWNYTYTNISVKKPTEYIYQVKTNNGLLDERVITFFPKEGEKLEFFNSYGFGSLIFSLFLIIFFI